MPPFFPFLFFFFFFLVRYLPFHVVRSKSISLQQPSPSQPEVEVIAGFSFKTRLLISCVTLANYLTNIFKYSEFQLSFM